MRTRGGKKKIDVLVKRKLGDRQNRKLWRRSNRKNSKPVRRPAKSDDADRKYRGKLSPVHTLIGERRMNGKDVKTLRRKSKKKERPVRKRRRNRRKSGRYVKTQRRKSKKKGP